MATTSTYQVSPISLRIDTIGLHPSKLKISLTSDSSTSGGISRNIIVLLPCALAEVTLILFSSVIETTVEPSNALIIIDSSCVSALTLANYNLVKEM